VANRSTERVVNSSTGRSSWVSVPLNATPEIQSEAGAVKGAAAAGHSMFLPWEVCMGPFQTVGWKKVSDDRPTPMQKSDLSIVALKPVKAGGAKGEMD
jgi:hypothetical protein